MSLAFIIDLGVLDVDMCSISVLKDPACYSPEYPTPMKGTPKPLID